MTWEELRRLLVEHIQEEQAVMDCTQGQRTEEERQRYNLALGAALAYDGLLGLLEDKEVRRGDGNA